MTVNAVRSDVTLTMVGTELPVVMTAALEYDSRDPYAVAAVFYAPSEPVRWVFARDLLDEGLVNEVGDGDVQVLPRTSEDGDSLVQLRLSSPDGVAILETDVDHVLMFLARSYALVSPGSESDHLDIDAELARLLTN